MKDLIMNRCRLVANEVWNGGKPENKKKYGDKIEEIEKSLAKEKKIAGDKDLPEFIIWATKNLAEKRKTGK